MNRITITTSIELTEDKKAEIVNKLQKKYGKKEVYFHVDNEIIGGIVMFDGDKVYDGSIRMQLNKFKEKIKK